MTEENKKIVVQVDAELEEIVPRFLENRRNELPKLQLALEKGDFETIRILAHSMKGAGGGYGFDAITDIGAALESAAKEKRAEEIARRLEELTRYLQRVEPIFK